jgi:hypothetical protein
MHYINIRSLKSLVVLLLTLFTISVVNVADLKKGANLFKLPTVPLVTTKT